MATIKATVVVKRPVAVTIKRHVVNVSVGKAGPQGEANTLTIGTVVGGPTAAATITHQDLHSSPTRPPPNL